jgi:hypothetical protein
LKNILFFKLSHNSKDTGGLVFLVSAYTSWPSSSGLRGRRRTYLTIFELADHALLKMVKYVFLCLLRPELVGQDVEPSSHEGASATFR